MQCCCTPIFYACSEICDLASRYQSALLLSVRGPVDSGQSVSTALLVGTFSSLMIAEKALKFGLFESPVERSTVSVDS